MQGPRGTPSVSLPLPLSARRAGGWAAAPLESGSYPPNPNAMQSHPSRHIRPPPRPLRGRLSPFPAPLPQNDRRSASMRSRCCHGSAVEVLAPTSAPAPQPKEALTGSGEPSPPSPFPHCQHRHCLGGDQVRGLSGLRQSHAHQTARKICISSTRGWVSGESSPEKTSIYRENVT